APTRWVWLSWGADGGHCQVAARLVSLREDGPSVTCRTPPPPGRPAEIEVEVGDEPGHTAEVTVAAGRAVARGTYLVRLRFAGPCAPAFWDAASACLEAVE